MKLFLTLWGCWSLKMKLFLSFVFISLITLISMNYPQKDGDSSLFNNPIINFSSCTCDDATLCLSSDEVMRLNIYITYLKERLHNEENNTIRRRHRSP